MPVIQTMRAVSGAGSLLVTAVVFLWCSMVVGTADGVTEGSNAATVPADMTRSPLQM